MPEHSIYTIYLPVVLKERMYECDSIASIIHISFEG